MEDSYINKIDILCTLLSQRIPADQFQLWGLEIHWMDSKYDTPENNAIVADVIKNYETLAAAAEAETAVELVRKQREARYRAESDPLFFREQRGEEEPGTWKAKVAEIRADLPYPEEGGRFVTNYSNGAGVIVE